MKILFFTDSVSQYKTFGNAIRTCSFANNLFRRGHEVSVVYSKKGRTIDTLKGINLFHLDFKKIIQKISLIKDQLKSSDLIILSLFWEPSHILFIILYFLYYKNKPYLIMTNGSLPIDKKSFFIKNLYMLLFGNLIIKNASLLIAVTKVELKILKELYNKKIVHLNNGLEKNLLNNDEKYIKKEKKDFINLTYLGRLHYIKGIDILIRAISLITKNKNFKIRLNIAGPDFGELKKLKKLIKSLNLPNETVNFLGNLSGENKINFYRKSDLHIVPSLREAMSIVAIEAGYISNSRVLVTNECGIGDIKEISKYFEYCDANESSLSKKIIKILSDTETSSFKDFISERKALIRNTFSWEKLTISLEKEIYQIIN